jgi:hypothetical protein
MKKMLTALAVVALFSTTGCYTSRRVAGDSLTGGITNPYLWVTVPVDTLMSPYQIPKWLSDDDDPWTPWSPDDIREEYEQDSDIVTIE